MQLLLLIQFFFSSSFWIWPFFLITHCFSKLIEAQNYAPFNNLQIKTFFWVKSLMCTKIQYFITEGSYKENTFSREKFFQSFVWQNYKLFSKVWIYIQNCKHLWSVISKPVILQYLNKSNTFLHKPCTNSSKYFSKIS